MSNTIAELKGLNIDKVVDRMKLSVLANHIVKSLHEMTTKQPHASATTGKCSAVNIVLDSMMTWLTRRSLFAAHNEHVPRHTVRPPCGPARLEPTVFDGNF